MKASRRQELRTNELAQTLEELRDFFRAYGNYVVGVLVVVAAVVLVWFYLQYSAREALAEAKRQARALPYDTDAEVRASVSKLVELAADTEDEDFLAEAIQGRAQMAMSRVNVGEDGTPAAEFLDLAADAYQELLERVPHRTLEKGAALFGLATIEADRFVLDRDLAHREKARQYLERIRDGVEFNGTPFKALALEQLNGLDDVFVVVALAAPLPPPAIPQLPPALQPLPSGPTTEQESTSVGHPEAPGFEIRQSGVELIPISKDEVPPEVTQVKPPPAEQDELLPEEGEPPAEQPEPAAEQSAPPQDADLTSPDADR